MLRCTTGSSRPIAPVSCSLTSALSASAQTADSASLSRPSNPSTPSNSAVASEALPAPPPPLPPPPLPRRRCRQEPPPPPQPRPLPEAAAAEAAFAAATVAEVTAATIATSTAAASSRSCLLQRASLAAPLLPPPVGLFSRAFDHPRPPPPPPPLLSSPSVPPAPLPKSPSDDKDRTASDRPPHAWRLASRARQEGVPGDVSRPPPPPPAGAVAGCWPGDVSKMSRRRIDAPAARISTSSDFCSTAGVTVPGQVGVRQNTKGSGINLALTGGGIRTGNNTKFNKDNTRFVLAYLAPVFRKKKKTGHGHHPTLSFRPVHRSNKPCSNPPQATGTVADSHFTPILYQSHQQTNNGPDPARHCLAATTRARRAEHLGPGRLPDAGPAGEQRAQTPRPLDRGPSQGQDQREQPCDDAAGTAVSDVGGGAGACLPAAAATAAAASRCVLVCVSCCC